MTKISTAFALVVGAALLAGCSVSVDGPAPDGPAPAKPASPMTAAADPTGYPAEGEARRSNHSDVDLTVGCPNQSLVFAEDDQVIRVTEPCGQITINANYVVVLAEHVGTVVVATNASDNLVLARSIDSVQVLGDYARVFWDAGMPKTVVVTGQESTANPNPAPEP